MSAKKLLLFIATLFLLVGTVYGQQFFNLMDEVQSVPAPLLYKEGIHTSPDGGRYSRLSKSVINTGQPSQHKELRAAGDVLFTYSYNQTYPGTWGCFFWEEKVYLTRWNAKASDNATGKVYRFTISGNTLVPDGDFIIPGITGTYNLEGFTTDGTYIYAVNEENCIYKIDPKTWTVVETIPTAYSDPNSIAYDEATGGFWLAQLGVSVITLVTSDGTPTNTTLEATNQYGTTGLAYDGVSEGGPYLIQAVGSSENQNVAQLNRWKIATGAYEENIYTQPESPASGRSSAGIYTYGSNSKFNLIGVNQGGKVVYGIELADLVAAEAPAAVTDITVTPGASGALTAVITWKNPTLTYNGASLAGLTSVKIYRNDETIPTHTISNPVPGSTGSYTVSVSAGGTHKFKIIASNGAGNGLPAVTTAWIGPDVPAAPGNVVLVKNNTAATVSWEAPIIGLHQGWLAPAGIVYDVFRYPGGYKVKADFDGLTFSETITELSSVYYKVVAKNAVGEGGATRSNPQAYCNYITSFPYKYGFEEEDLLFPACWEQEYISGTTGWIIARNDDFYPSEIHEGSYHAILTSTKRGTRTILSTPPMDLSGMTLPMLQLWHLQLPLGWDQDILKVYYKTSIGAEWILLKEFPDAAAVWTERLLALPNPSAEYYIGFEGHITYASNPPGTSGGFGHGYGVKLDDIMVDEAPADPVISGSALAFGNVANNLPWPVSKKYVIQNRGGAALTVDAVKSATQGITVTGLPLTIAPLDTASITVHFTPKDLPLGAYGGNFVLTSNDLAMPEFTVNVTTTLAVASISAPLEENFNTGGTLIGWLNTGFSQQTSGGVNNTPSLRANLYGEIGIIQTSYVDMGPSPKMSFSFKAINRTTGAPATAEQLYYDVIITKDNGKTAARVLNVPEGSHVPSANHELVNVDVSEYANELCLVQIRFYAVSPADLYVYVDDITIGSTLANDLTALSITGSSVPTVGMLEHYTVSVKNIGTDVQTDYAVKLMQRSATEGAEDIEVASLLGVTIAKNETRQFIFDWTPGEEGAVVLYGKVVSAADENAKNNQSGIINIAIQPEGIKGIVVGTGNSQSFIPYNLVHSKSLSQSLYYPHELGTNGGDILSLTYRASIASIGNKLQNIPIQVWIGETTLPTLQNEWVPLSSLTEVFNGTMNFPSGTQDVTVTLDQPYQYNGGTLVIYSYRPDCGIQGSVGDMFFVTALPDESYRSRIYSASAASVTLDPANPRFGMEVHAVPNTTLKLDMQGTGLLSGVVRNDTEPLEGVKIQIAGTALYTYTDAAGNYAFNLKPGNYTLEASVYGYLDQTIPVTITADDKINKDITMIAFSVYKLSGKVTDAISGDAVKGATVKLTGYNDYETKTDASGNYEIAEVYGGTTFEYTVNVTVASHSDYAGTVTVTDNTTYNIVLDRIPYPVTSVLATANAANTEVIITWTKPEISREYRYDNGICNGQLSFNSVNPKSVVGSVFREGATLSKMSWYITDAFTPNATGVNLFVFKLDANGMPTNEVIYSKTDVISAKEEWTTFEFPEPVNAPNGFYLAISQSTEPLSIGTSAPDTEYPYPLQTYFYSTNYTNGNFVLESKFEYHFMIRAQGKPMDNTSNTTQTALMLTGNKSTAKAVDTAAPAVLHYTVETPKMTAQSLTTRNGEEAPAPVNYTVYRLLQGSAQNEWEEVVVNVTGLTTTDVDWATIAPGEYLYAVVANYPNRVSVPKHSNILSKSMTVSYKVNIATNTTSANAEGAVVVLTNIDGKSEHVYSMTSGAKGIEFPAVWRGTYNIAISKDFFASYTASGLDVSVEGQSHEAELIEIIENPYRLKIAQNGVSADFSWNNAPDPVSSFSDDMESYADFIIENIGEYTLIDGDGVKTGGIQDVTYPNMGYTGSFMVMNSTKSNPALGAAWAGHSGEKVLASFYAAGTANNDWLITPRIIVEANAVFTFWAKSVHSDYLESFKVAVSTTGKSMSDFTVFANQGTVNSVPSAEWTQYSYDLSAYAGQEVYLAINCISNDKFALLIDDLAIGVPNTGGDQSVVFSSPEHTRAAGEVLSYTVYLDDQAVARNVRTTNYTFDYVSAGLHTAGVEAVYGSGASERKTIDFTMEDGVILLNGFEIEHGAEVTPYRTVRLSFDVSGGMPSHYMVSEDRNFAGAAWVAYTSTPTYTFVTADAGLKTLYAKLKNSETPETVSQIDTIYYKAAPEKLPLDHYRRMQARMYPNPAGSVVNVSVEHAPSEVQVSIYSVTGERYYSRTYSNSDFVIDLSSCPSGILIVKISSGKEQSVQRLLKQ